MYVCDLISEIKDLSLKFRNELLVLFVISTFHCFSLFGKFTFMHCFVLFLDRVGAWVWGGG